MESCDASGQNVLAKDIILALDPHIRTVVTTALEKHKANFIQQSKDECKS
jgi:hypothetical protein